MDIKEKVRAILPHVSKPSRYLGNEWNAVDKDPASVKLRFALVFPDLYEVGMSHLGFKILYEIINKQEDLAAERVFAPAVDMEAVMRRLHIPLFSLESGTSLSVFDLVGFTLQHELSYTNILNMLDLADIPRLQAERLPADPLVIGGGPGAFNPEPLAPFFDAFVLGDGEEIILEITGLYRRWREEQRRDRQELLTALALIPGIYVPSFYRDHYDRQGNFAGIEVLHPAAPVAITKRVARLTADDYPVRQVVPYMDVIHDRGILEIFRGCTRGCRFCQAGIIYRPVRERKVQELKKLAMQLVKETGYDEVSLASLSSADYPGIVQLVHELSTCFGDNYINLSLPSLRIDSFSVNLAREVQKVRKSGLTFAPEAGTQRLRQVINKNVTETDLFNAVADAFEAGWNNLKLYFMIGLPTETDEDLQGIVALSEHVTRLYREKKYRQGRLRLAVSVSIFVPKAHTPFQWEPQITGVEARQRQQFLKDRLPRIRAVRYSYADQEMSMLEAVFARGDRRLAPVLAVARDKGCRFDSWNEHFSFDRWQQAFIENQVNPYDYAYWRPALDAPLPWDHLHTGVQKKYLAQEYRRGLKGETSPDCREGQCLNCGLEGVCLGSKD